MDLIEELDALLEKRQHLNVNMVEKFRKEFLVLMKNVKRLRNAKDAYALKKALFGWAERFEEYAKQIRNDLNDRTSLRDPDANTSWAQEHERTMKAVWDFSWEVGHMPLESWEYVKKYNRDRYPDAEAVYQASKEDIRKWESRVKSKARLAWKWMKEVGEWATRKDLQGGGGRPITINTMERENINLEGFKIQLVGFDEGDSFHQKGLAKVKAALRVYKQRAGKVYPWLLKYQLPMVLLFEGGKDSAAATYEKDHITVTTWGIHAGSPAEGARVFAHEMGHHLFQQVLSGKAQQAWDNFVKGSYVTLDLKTVLAKLKPGEKLSDLDDRIEKTDPILHLQLQTLLHDISYKSLDLYTFDRIKEYLDKGGDPNVRVPALPISGYAAKNPEEAFCEALGILVGYGPQAVLPQVREMMRTLVSGVRLESKMWGLIEDLKQAVFPGNPETP